VHNRGQEVQLADRSGNTNRRARPELTRAGHSRAYCGLYPSTWPTNRMGTKATEAI